MPHWTTATEPYKCRGCGKKRPAGELVFVPGLKPYCPNCGREAEASIERWEAFKARNELALAGGR